MNEIDWHKTGEAGAGVLAGVGALFMGLRKFFSPNGNGKILEKLDKMDEKIDMLGNEVAELRGRFDGYLSGRG